MSDPTQKPGFFGKAGLLFRQELLIACLPELVGFAAIRQLQRKPFEHAHEIAARVRVYSRAPEKFRRVRLARSKIASRPGGQRRWAGVKR